MILIVSIYKVLTRTSGTYVLYAAKSLQSCLTLCDPIGGSPPGSSVPGFSRQEHWSGLPFPSPMRESESEVAQSCPTGSDAMDCSPPGERLLLNHERLRDSWPLEEKNSNRA